MTKRLIHVVILCILLSFGALWYLGRLIIPSYALMSSSEELRKATGKDVYIGAVRFSGIRGVVLEDVVIYDKKRVLVWAKEISFSVKLSAMLKNGFIIPSMLIRSPAIYLERRCDGTFSLSELFATDYKPSLVLAVATHKVIIKNGRLIFLDRMTDPVFKERFDDIDVLLDVSDPDKIGFNFSCVVPLERNMEIKAAGDYLINEKEFSASLAFSDLFPPEFDLYYRSSGVSILSGYMDILADIKMSASKVNMNINGTIKGLSISKNNMKIRMNSGISAFVSYDAQSGKANYNGRFPEALIDAEGIFGLAELKGVKADIEFNNDRVYSDDLELDLFGFRWKVKINVANFADPILDIYASTRAQLSVVKKALFKEFNIKIQNDISGIADIEVGAQSVSGGDPDINGYVKVYDAVINMGSKMAPFKHINGELYFNPGLLKWSDLSLQYNDEKYVVSGSVKNFDAPQVNLSVSSDNLDFKADIVSRGSSIDIKDLKGSYYNSGFSIKGLADISGLDNLKVNINAEADIKLDDLDDIFKDSKFVKSLDLKGGAKVSAFIDGYIADLLSCRIKTRFKSARVRTGDIIIDNIDLDYIQENGRGTLRSFAAEFSGGNIWVTGRIDWLAKGARYLFNIDAKGVEFEKLKRYFGINDKDISGDIKGSVHMEGIFNDIDTMTAQGRIVLSNGRLWELNLFQGLGSMIFSSDFSNIVFTEGSLDFKVKDRQVISDYLVLNSDLLKLYGSGRIGFDKSLNASLNAEIKEDSMYPGTRRSIALAVGRNTDIKVAGTLEKPVFKMSANVSDMISGIAGEIMKAPD